MSDQGRELLATIHYTTACSCFGAFREMEIFVKADGESLVDSNAGVGGHLRLVTKKPEWS